MSLETKGNTKLAGVNSNSPANNKFQMSEKISDYTKRVNSIQKSSEQAAENRRLAEIAQQNFNAVVDTNSIRPDSISPNAQRYVDLDSAQQRKLRDYGLQTGWGDSNADINKMLKQEQSVLGDVLRSGGQFFTNLAVGIYDSFAGWADLDNTIAVGFGNTEYGLDEDNSLTKWVHKLQDEANKELAIFKDGDEDFLSWVGMANGIGQFGYSVGIIAEGLAEQALLTAITMGTAGGGGVVQAAAAANKIDKILKLGKLGDKALKAINTGSKILGKGAIFGTLQGAKELGANARDTYEAVKERLISEGISPEEANEAAIIATSNAIKTEAGVTLTLSALQYSLFGNAFKSVKKNPFTRMKNGGFSWGTSDFISGSFEKLTGKIKNTAVREVAETATNMLGELGEEGLQAGNTNYWVEDTLNSKGIYDFHTKWENTFNDEFWSAAIGGAFGGAAFNMTHKLAGKGRENKLNDERKELLERSISKYKSIYEKMSTMEPKTEQEKQYLKKQANLINVYHAMEHDYMSGDTTAFENYFEHLNHLKQEIEAGNTKGIPEGMTAQDITDMIIQAEEMRNQLIDNYNTTDDDFGLAMEMTQKQQSSKQLKLIEDHYRKQKDKANTIEFNALKGIKDQELRKKLLKFNDVATEYYSQENENKSKLLEDNLQTILEKVNERKTDEVNSLGRNLTSEEESAIYQEVQDNFLKDNYKEDPENELAKQFHELSKELEERRDKGEFAQETLNALMKSNGVLFSKKLKEIGEERASLKKDIKAMSSGKYQREYRENLIKKKTEEIAKQVKEIDENPNYSKKQKDFMKRELVGYNKGFLARAYNWITKADPRAAEEKESKESKKESKKEGGFFSKIKNIFNKSEKQKQEEAPKGNIKMQKTNLALHIKSNPKDIKLENIIEESKKISLKDDGSAYVDENGKEYKRVHSVKTIKSGDLDVAISEFEKAHKEFTELQNPTQDDITNFLNKYLDLFYSSTFLKESAVQENSKLKEFVNKVNALADKDRDTILKELDNLKEEYIAFTQFHLRLGNLVDTAARNILKNPDITLDEVKQILEKEIGKEYSELINEKALQSTFDYFSKIRNDFNEAGYTLYTDSVKFFHDFGAKEGIDDPNKRVAGEVDVLVVDKNGYVVGIWDVKTIGKKSPHNVYTDPYTGLKQASKIDGYREQLSLYSDLLYHQYSITLGEAPLFEKEGVKYTPLGLFFMGFDKQIQNLNSGLAFQDTTKPEPVNYLSNGEALSSGSIYAKEIQGINFNSNPNDEINPEGTTIKGTEDGEEDGNIADDNNTPEDNPNNNPDDNNLGGIPSNINEMLGIPIDNEAQTTNFFLNKREAVSKLEEEIRALEAQGHTDNYYETIYNNLKEKLTVYQEVSDFLKALSEEDKEAIITLMKDLIKHKVFIADNGNLVSPFKVEDGRLITKGNYYKISYSINGKNTIANNADIEIVFQNGKALVKVNDDNFDADSIISITTSTKVEDTKNKALSTMQGHFFNDPTQSYDKYYEQMVEFFSMLEEHYGDSFDLDTILSNLISDNVAVYNMMKNPTIFINFVNTYNRIKGTNISPEPLYMNIYGNTTYATEGFISALKKVYDAENGTQFTPPIIPTTVPTTTSKKGNQTPQHVDSNSITFVDSSGNAVVLSDDRQVYPSLGENAYIIKDGKPLEKSVSDSNILNSLEEGKIEKENNVRVIPLLDKSDLDKYKKLIPEGEYNSALKNINDYHKSSEEDKSVSDIPMLLLTEDDTFIGWFPNVDTHLRNFKGTANSNEDIQKTIAQRLNILEKAKELKDNGNITEIITTISDIKITEALFNGDKKIPLTESLDIDSKIRSIQRDSGSEFKNHLNSIMSNIFVGVVFSDKLKVFGKELSINLKDGISNSNGLITIDGKFLGVSSTDIYLKVDKNSFSKEKTTSSVVIVYDGEFDNKKVYRMIAVNNTKVNTNNIKHKLLLEAIAGYYITLLNNHKNVYSNTPSETTINKIDKSNYENFTERFLKRFIYSKDIDKLFNINSDINRLNKLNINSHEYNTELSKIKDEFLINFKDYAFSDVILNISPSSFNNNGEQNPLPSVFKNIVDNLVNKKIESGAINAEDKDFYVQFLTNDYYRQFSILNTNRVFAFDHDKAGNPLYTLYKRPVVTLKEITPTNKQEEKAAEIVSQDLRKRQLSATKVVDTEGVIIPTNSEETSSSSLSDDNSTKPGESGNDNNNGRGTVLLSSLSKKTSDNENIVSTVTYSINEDLKDIKGNSELNSLLGPLSDISKKLGFILFDDNNYQITLSRSTEELSYLFSEILSNTDNGVPHILRNAIIEQMINLINERIRDNVLKGNDINNTEYIKEVTSEILRYIDNLREDLNSLLNSVNKSNSNYKEHISIIVDNYSTILDNIVEALNPNNPSNLYSEALDQYDRITDFKLGYETKIKELVTEDSKEDLSDALTAIENDLSPSESFVDVLDDTTKRSATKEIRALLSSIKKQVIEDSETTTLLGMPEYYDFDAIFNFLEEAMHFPITAGNDIDNIINLLKNRLATTEHKYIYSNIIDILEKLNSDKNSKQHLNKLLFLMNKRYNIAHSIISKDGKYKLIETNSNNTLLKTSLILEQEGKNIISELKANSEKKAYVNSLIKAFDTVLYGEESNDSIKNALLTLNESYPNIFNNTLQDKDFKEKLLKELIKNMGFTTIPNALEIFKHGIIHKGLVKDTVYKISPDPKSGDLSLFTKDNPFAISVSTLKSALRENNDKNHLSRNLRSMSYIIETFSVYNTDSYSKMYRDAGKTVSSFTKPRQVNDIMVKLTQDFEYRKRILEGTNSNLSWINLLHNSHILRESVWAAKSFSVNVNNEDLDTTFQQTPELNRIKYATTLYDTTIYKDLLKDGVIDKNTLIEMGIPTDKNTGELKYGIRLNNMMYSTMSDKSQFMFGTSIALNMRDVLLGRAIDLLNSDDNLDKNFNNSLKAILQELKPFLFNNIISPELNRIKDYYKNPHLYNTAGNTIAYRLFTNFPRLNSAKVNINEEEYYVVNLLNNLSSFSNNDSVIEKELNEKIEDALYDTLSDYLVSVFNKNPSYDDNVKDALKDTYLYESSIKNFSNYADYVLKASYVELKINELINSSNQEMLLTGDFAHFSADKYFNKEMFSSEISSPVLKHKNENNEEVNVEDIIATVKKHIMDKTSTNHGKRMAMVIAQGNTLANSDSKNQDINPDYIQIMMEDVSSVPNNIESIIAIHYPDYKKHERYDDIIRPALDSLANESYNSDYASQLAELFPDIAAFFDISTTDAQEYTTIKEHLDILVRQGDISENQKEILLKKYTSQTEEGVDDSNKFSEEELKVILQPIKPVYAGIIPSYGSHVDRPVYVKSSSYPLIPQITAGLEIDKLRQYLEKVQKVTGKNVRASYQSANKVGAVSNPLKVWNNDGSFNTDLNDDIDLHATEIKKGNALRDLIQDANSSAVSKSYLVLPRSNFKIQLKVPVKEKEYISMGTQIAKLLFGNGVLDIEGNVFEFGGNKVSAKELSEIYYKSYNDLIKLKSLELYNFLGLDSNGDIIDYDTTFNTLREIMLKEAKANNYSEQKIKMLDKDFTKASKDLNKFVVDLGLNPASESFQSLIMSYLNKRIFSVKLPGTSLVTTSSAGYVKAKESDLDKNSWHSKIIYTDKWEGNLSGTQIKNDKVVSAKVLMPAKFKIDGEWLNFFDENGEPNPDFVIKDEETGVYKIKPGSIDEELLKRVSFRIPTSAHLSASVIEIAGFLPPEAGDIIVVPDQLITQKGLDFDIDKENIYGYYSKIISTTNEDGSITKKLVRHRATVGKSNREATVDNLTRVSVNVQKENVNKSIYGVHLFLDKKEVYTKGEYNELHNMIISKDSDIDKDKFIELFDKVLENPFENKKALSLLKEAIEGIKISAELADLISNFNPIFKDKSAFSKQIIDKYISENEETLRELYDKIKSNYSLDGKVYLSSDNPLMSQALSYLFLKDKYENSDNILENELSKTKYKKVTYNNSKNIDVYVANGNTSINKEDYFILYSNSFSDHALETTKEDLRQAISENKPILIYYNNAPENKTINKNLDKLFKDNDIDTTNYVPIIKRKEKIYSNLKKEETSVKIGGSAQLQKHIPVNSPVTIINNEYITSNSKAAKGNNIRELPNAITDFEEDSKLESLYNSAFGIEDTTKDDFTTKTRKTVVYNVYNADAIYYIDSFDPKDLNRYRNNYLTVAKAAKKPMYIYNTQKKQWYYVNYNESGNTLISYNNVPYLSKNAFITTKSNFKSDKERQEFYAFLSNNKLIPNLLGTKLENTANPIEEYDSRVNDLFSEKEHIEGTINEQSLSNIEKNIKNNMIEVHLAVLSNLEMQSKIVRVLSMENAKAQVKLLNPHSSDFEFMGETSYQQHKATLGAAGKMAIGVYSNGVVKLSQLQQWSKFYPDKKVKLKVTFEDNGTNKQEKDSYFKFGFKINGQSLNFDGSREGWGEHIYAKQLKGDSKKPRALATVLEERQNTATDNEKEQILGMLNVTSDTIGAESMMIMLGFDEVPLGENRVSLPYLMLKSPAVMKIAKMLKGEYDTNDMSYKGNTQAIWDKYSKELNSVDITDINIDTIFNSLGKDFNELNNNNSTDYNKDEYTENLKILKLFLTLHKLSKEQLKFNRITNIHAKKLGNTVSSALELYDLYDNGLKNSENTFENIESFAKSDYVLARTPIESSRPLVNMLKGLFGSNAMFFPSSIKLNSRSWNDPSIKERVLREYSINKYVLDSIGLKDKITLNMLYDNYTKKSPLIQVIQKLKSSNNILLQNNDFFKRLRIGSSLTLGQERLYLDFNISDSWEENKLNTAVSQLLADDTTILAEIVITSSEGIPYSIKITPKKLAELLLDYSLIMQNSSSYGLISRVYPTNIIIDKIKGATHALTDSISDYSKVTTDRDIAIYMAKNMPNVLHTVYDKSGKIPNVDIYSIKKHPIGHHIIVSGNNRYIAIQDSPDNTSAEDDVYYTLYNIDSLNINSNWNNLYKYSGINPSLINLQKELGLDTTISVEKALSALGTNNRFSKEFSNFISNLSKYNTNSEIKVEVIKSQYSRYDYVNNVIYLSAEKLKETNLIEEDFIHELGHAFTVNHLFNLGIHANITDEELLNKYISWSSLQGENAEKLKPVLGVIQTYLKAKEHLKDDKDHSYYVSNIFEFISGTISNKGFAEKLNRIEGISEDEYKGVALSIIDDIINILKEFITNFFGISEVNKKHLFAQAFANSINLMENSTTFTKEFTSNLNEEIRVLEEQYQNELKEKEIFENITPTSFSETDKIIIDEKTYTAKEVIEKLKANDIELIKELADFGYKIYITPKATNGKEYLQKVLNAVYPYKIGDKRKGTVTSGLRVIDKVNYLEIGNSKQKKTFAILSDNVITTIAAHTEIINKANLGLSIINNNC